MSNPLKILRTDRRIRYICPGAKSGRLMNGFTDLEAQRLLTERLKGIGVHIGRGKQDGGRGRLIVWTATVLVAVCAVGAWSQESGGPVDETHPASVGGWLAPICYVLKVALDLINGVIGNWGASIIILALVFRVFLFPLSKYGMRHQAKSKDAQERIKPLIAEIKEKHKGNADKRDEEILRLYHEHGLDALSQLKGSLTLLVQLPILIALYRLLGQSGELAGIKFLWINDLSLPDALFSFGVALPWLGGTFNLLPIIMFVSQVSIAHKMARTVSSDGAKPKSAYSMFVMPGIMLLLFYPFPSGCMLYWTTSNVCQAIEQRIGK